MGARASTVLYRTLVSNRAGFGTGKFMLPANICPIVPVTFLKAGVAFEFVDIDPDTQCMDTGQLRARLRRDKTSVCGILFVHSYGNYQDITSLFHGLRSEYPAIFFIDDRCLCIPDTSGQSILESADLTLFSTGYAKFVELGEGGFGYLNERTVYEEVSGPFDEAAHNYLVQQMNHVIKADQAFMYEDSAWLQFDHELNEETYFDRVDGRIPEAKAQKELLNSIYAAHLPPELQLGTRHNWRFNLQVADKEEVLRRIFESGLFASSHYASVARIFGGSAAPKAEQQHRHMVNLFNDHRYTPEMALKVCQVINQTLV